MLSQNLEQTAYFLLCAIVGLIILGMAANEWRRLRTDEYRRVAIAALVLVLGRGAGLLLLRSGLAPDGLCLEWALQGLTLAIMIWAYPVASFSTSRWTGIFMIGALVSVGLSAALCFLAPLTPRPVVLFLLNGIALALWLRTRHPHSLWLGSALLLSLSGAVGGLLGLESIALAAHLAALCLLAIETYRGIVADLSAYGQELREISNQALSQTQNLAFLFEVSRTITASLDLSVVLERVSESVARTVNADWAYVLLHDDDDPDKLVMAARYGWWGRRWMQDNQIHRRVLVSLSDFSLLKHAVLRRRQVLANQPEDYEQFEKLHDALARPQSGPTLIQPIHLQDKSLGALLLGHVGTHRTFSQADGKLCKALVGQVATAIENARLYQNVDEQARRLAELLRDREEEATERQAILESITDGVIVAGQAGEVVLLNAAAERILGIPRDQLVGQTIKRLYAELLQSGSKRTGAQAVFEWNGKMVMGSLAPVKMPDGTILGYVGTFRDVTLEQQAREAKSEFVATVSHELRTPMTSIKGYVELLVAGAVGSINPQQRHFLDIVSTNAERMIGLVNNLIAASEMDRGPIEIEPLPVDMAQVIRDAVQAVRPQASKGQIDVVVNLPPDLSPVRGDAQGLRQIMDNLLDNALHYTHPQGRITVWAAEAHLEDLRDFLVISVRDTGVGIPVEEHEHIFEKFYRVNNPLSLKAGGTGMGLAIVKSLVTAHGGRVWVESKPEAGSTFSFTVPTT